MSWSDLQTSSGSGTPGGNNGEIQFNDNGAFAGATYLTYNKSTGLVTATNTLSVGRLQVNISSNSGGIVIKPPSTSEKGIVIQQNSSQTANLLELQNSSGSVISYFDRNGYFSGTHVGACCSSTTSQTINNVTTAKITFSTEVFDYDDMYTTASPNQITIKSSGNYLVAFDAILSTQGSGTNANMTFMLQKNSALIGADTVSWPNGAANVGVSSMWIKQLATNDVIEIYGYAYYANLTIGTRYFTILRI